MQSAAAIRPGRMSAVLALAPELAESVVAEIRARVPGSYLSVANINTPRPGDCRRGTLASLGELPEAAKAAGARRVVPLEVSGAFHTVAMLPARGRDA